MSTQINGEGQFEFEVWRERAYEDLTEKLGNTERGQLRALAEPGGPLWTIQQNMVDYARRLEKALSSCDLLNPATLQKAIALQSELRAVDWQRRMWERVLSPVPEPEVTEEQDDG